MVTDCLTGRQADASTSAHAGLGQSGAPGTLRGTVHAGAEGDDEAVICALCLSPIQLGIAGIVSRFPTQASLYLNGVQPPELARVEAGRIVVEAWQETEVGSR